MSTQACAYRFGASRDEHAVIGAGPRKKMQTFYSDSAARAEILAIRVSILAARYIGRHDPTGVRK